jgi:hypothetical protein
VPKSYFDALKEIIEAKESEVQTVPISDSSNILMIPKSCSELYATLENFIFNIVNTQFILKPASYLHESKSGTQCFLGFASIPDEQNQFILGNYFLHQFYTVLDFERNVVMVGRKENGLEESDMVMLREFVPPAAAAPVAPASVERNDEKVPAKEDEAQPSAETSMEHSSLQSDMDKIAKR